MVANKKDYKSIKKGPGFVHLKQNVWGSHNTIFETYVVVASFILWELMT